MGANHQALMMVGYYPFGSLFNGTTNWLDRSSDFSGNADGTTGILSFWFRLDSLGVPNNTPFIYYGPNVTYGPRVYFNSPGITPSKLFFDSFTNAGGARVSMSSTTAFGASASWQHVILVWDSASTPNCQVVVNGANDAPTVSRNAGTISYTGTDHTIGAVVGGVGNKYLGCISEFYYAPNQWIDLTVAANVQKFRSSGGHPVFLGSNGSVPTGVAPIYYMKGKASTITTNFGTGGNMTAHGIFTDSSTNP